MLATSDDDGETWSKPRLVVDAHAKDLPADRSVLVGNLWTDPLGRLWLIFDQSMDMFDGRAGVWAAVCEIPTPKEPVWSAPAPHLARRHAQQADRAFDRRMDAADLARPARGLRQFKGCFKELDPLRGANVFVSTDKGAPGSAAAPCSFPIPTGTST